MLFDTYSCICHTSNSSSRGFSSNQGLSSSQLSRLEKKIQKIRQAAIKNKKKEQIKEKRFSQVLGWIEERYRSSRVQEKILLKMIRKKVRALKIKKAIENDRFQVANETYSLRRLASHFLQDELQEIDRLLEQGLLMKEKKNHGSLSILKKYIASVL